MAEQAPSAPDAPAATSTPALAPGMALPAAVLTLADGTMVSTDALAAPGGQLVLFTFPKAGTPGCTREAREFSDAAPAFAAAGVAVVGVSRDPPAALARFAERQGLAITLASDATGALTDALGLWGERQLYGRRYMGLERASLLVGADGRIARVWRRVRVAGHVAAVLEAVSGPSPEGAGGAP